MQKNINQYLKLLLENFLDENWHNSFIGGDVKNWFEEKHLSEKDLEILVEFPLTLFKKKSDNEKDIYQKLLYLVFINEAQEYLEKDKNLFLERLPIFMIGLIDEIKVGRNGKEKLVSTQEIIEEYLIPIVTDLDDADIEKAEKIIKLNSR